MTELRGSAALELFFQSWSSAKHAHTVIAEDEASVAVLLPPVATCAKVKSLGNV
jgi:hypothetical protein